MSQDLKPCPFCGGKASIKGDWGLEALSCDDRTGECPGAFVSLPCHRPDRRSASIASWNTRTQAPAAEPHKPEPIRCPERLKPGGCQLHNLHCGWPACNKEKP